MRDGKLAVAATILLAPFVANADFITWTDWTSISSNSAIGNMGGIDVRVVANSGSIDGLSQTACGTNYWTQPNASDPAYTGGSADNAPTDCEQVGLNSAVSLTVSFSSPIDTLYMALLSVGQPRLTVTYDFDTAFSVDSDGVGYWSFANGGLPGPYSLGSGDTLSMNEFHGLLSFAGPVTTLSFTTSPNENWHAFTFGTATAVPEPGSLALLGIGFLALGAARRRLS